MKLHNGIIFGSSEGEGHGCTFTIQIPIIMEETKENKNNIIKGNDQPTAITQKLPDIPSYSSRNKSSRHRIHATDSREDSLPEMDNADIQNIIIPFDTMRSKSERFYLEGRSRVYKETYLKKNIHVSRCQSDRRLIINCEEKNSGLLSDAIVNPSPLAAVVEMKKDLKKRDIPSFKTTTTKILLVDDTPMNRKMMVRGLNARGYRDVVEAVDGVDGLRRFGE
eukprot:gene12395-26078_t